MKGGLRSCYLQVRQAPKGRRIGAVISHDPKNQGFTVVEVMIVLAVTGLLFISAAVVISGRTNKTQFEQSINQVTAQLRQSINEVSAGYYPNRGFQCVSNGGSVSITPGTTEQGKNSGCILIGRVLQFGVTNTDPQQFIAYPIVGRQLDNNGDQVESLAETGPRAISPATLSPNVPDSTDKQRLQYGLRAAKMYVNTEASPVGAVGFISSFATYEGTQVTSGAQRLTLVPVNGTALNMSQQATAQAINTQLATSTPNPTDGVFICFNSATTNQSGLVQIGGAGRQLSVTLKIRSTPC